MTRFHPRPIILTMDIILGLAFLTLPFIILL